MTLPNHPMDRTAGTYSGRRRCVQSVPANKRRKTMKKATADMASTLKCIDELANTFFSVSLHRTLGK
jgi:hypothetical protein